MSVINHESLFAPSADEWQIVEDRFDPKRAAHFETLFTLANGYAGVRGSLAMSPLLGDAGFYVAGVFDQVSGFTHEIVNLPCWLPMHADLDYFDFDFRKGKVLEYRRSLDMRRGMLFSTILWENEIQQVFRLESVRLMHQVEKHVSLTYGRITAPGASGNLQIGTTLDSWMVKHGSSSGRTRYGDVHVSDLGNGVSLDVTTQKTGVRVVEATSLTIPGASNRRVQADDDRVSESFTVPLEPNIPVYFEKRTVIFTSRDVADPVAAAASELSRVREISIDDLADSHARAWESIWSESDIVIDGDARAQKDIRFNLFHLLSLANPEDDRVSLGAKGLHGNGYSGLVFWDTEVYLVPPFIFTNPAVARALLQYRHHFLPDAVENARAAGRRGAFYPWNSSITGREDPQPGWQEHVGSDIAYAADQYVQATGDREFLLKYGAELIIATALYWSSRVELDPQKGYVIRDLMGPDEIHGNIDNNTYTNYLVQWHLRRAMQAVNELDAEAWRQIAQRYAITDEDVAEWKQIADQMYINFSTQHGFHEPFDGYFRLDEREIDRNMTQKHYTGPVLHSFRPTQVTKQADTVLLYYMFPNDFPEEVVRAAYEYCEPRCSHTSTLSRGLHAAVAARLGMTEDAHRQFLISAETDTGPTAGCDSGIHAACLGGNWQAVVMGFGGFSIRDGKASLSPHLPKDWQKLSFHLKWQGETISVDIRHDRVALQTAGGTVGMLVNGVLRQIGPNETSIPIPHEGTL